MSKSITTTIYNMDAAKEKIKKLDAMGVYFVHDSTSGSEKITFKKNGVTHKYFFCEDKNSEAFLRMVNLIKNEISKNLDKIENSPYRRLKMDKEYFSFAENCYNIGKTAGQCRSVSNCFEADVTAAYYQAAEKLGLISKKTYDWVIATVNKYERLRLLGSIASIKVRKIHNNGGIEGNPQLIKNNGLREAWFTICNYVDSCMKNFINMLGGNFLFYWVDGIYFKAPKKKPTQVMNEIFFNIEQLKKIYPLEWKVTPLIEFEIRNKGWIEIYLKKPHPKTDFEEAVFFPPVKKIKSFYLR